MTPTDILAERGPLAVLVEGYAPRAQQLEMAEAIGDALGSGESLVCEAGTGTGKTFAYLIPAVLSGLKIIISTGTRHLQDQLFNRDLPLVRKAVRAPFSAAMLKGRSNYLCLQRLKQAVAAGNPDGRVASRLTGITEWAAATATGDLAELPSLAEEDRLRALVTSTHENCLYQNCDDFEACHVFEARRRAMQADIVIVNHHLLLADLGLKEGGYGELLPPADAVIFDEAHQLPELASQFLSFTVSSHQCLDLLEDCRAAYLKEAGDHPDFMARVDRSESALLAFRAGLGTAAGSHPWGELSQSGENGALFRQWQEALEEALEVLEALEVRGKLLQGCFRRMQSLAGHLVDFVDAVRSTSIHWVEIRGRGFLLHRTPLDIAQGFQALVSGYGAAIFTSATLSVGGDFSHFAKRLGLSDVAARSWASPFLYRKQAILYVPEGMPDPRAEGYTERVVEECLPLLERLKGRAFVLFTSYRALNIAAPLMRKLLPFPVLVQGDAPRTELLETFRATPHAVLLGTGSFWEGVDVRGQALSCVVIDKLPFAALDDPVLKARLAKLEEEGRNPFKEYQVPEAVTALRQGFGRLIRDAADYGVLMLCDPRLLQKSYGRMFLRSLPDMMLTRSMADVDEFLKVHEAAAGEVAA